MPLWQSINTIVDNNGNTVVTETQPFPVTLVTPELVPPAPTLTATVNGTSVTLNWVRPDVQSVDTYKVYVDGAATPILGFITTWTPTDFTPGDHTFTVSGVNDAGEGPQSTPVTVTIASPPPPVVPPPGPPTDLSASVSGTTVTLSWTAITGADGNDIYQNGTKIAFPLVGALSTVNGKLTYVVTNLAPGNYAFAASSYNAHGEGTLSSLVSTTVAAPPPPVNANKAAIKAGLCMYPGDGSAPNQVTAWKGLSTKFGVTVNGVVMMTDSRPDGNGGSPFADSIWGEFVQATAWPSVSPHPAFTVVSVPLGFGGFTPSADQSAANLNAVINGSIDGHYQYLANNLVAAGYGNAIIRLGWEFDGNWMPWEATHHPDLYIAAFRHVQTLLKGISPNFKFDWCGAAGQPFDGTLAYPGDAYCDYIGMDIYDLNQDVRAALLPRGNFASAHNKPFTIPEWGLCKPTGDHPAFIQAIWDFLMGLAAPGVGYQSYFQGNPSNDNLAPHSLDNYPNSLALYKQLMNS